MAFVRIGLWVGLALSLLAIAGCRGANVVRPTAPAAMPTEPGTFSRMPNLK